MLTMLEEVPLGASGLQAGFLKTVLSRGASQESRSFQKGVSGFLAPGFSNNFRDMS
jgi:hypothetical protein